MSKQVRYGDQIYMELSNLQPPPTTDIRLLCSNSFLEENVFAVKSSTYNKTSFRNSVFVVLPSLVDSQADLDMLHSLGTELSFLSLGKPANVGEKYLKKEITQKEEQIGSSQETLKILNEKIMNEMENRTVRYGDVVLLKHLESGYYLCADSSYLPHNPTFYNLRLQKERTSNCYFKFFSYSVMTDRSPLDYEMEAKLVSAQLGTIVTMGPIRNSVDTLNLNQDDDEKENPEKPTFPADWLRREQPLKTFNNDLLVVGTTLESSDNNRIKLIEYCSKENLTAFNARKIIKNGDYVRFQIDDSYLTYSKTIYRQTFGLFNHNIEGYKYNFLNSIFQIVRMDDQDVYPKGVEIQSNPKTIEDDNDVAKYYLKHFVTGHYLSIPDENTYIHQAGDDDMLERPAEIPYFYLINNYLKNQKNPLTRNSRISLRAFKSKESAGEFYLESEIEKYEVLQLDTNSKYFVGFRNSEDKIRGKLKLVKKNITGNQAVGSFFKITSVNEEEMRKVMTFESYTNAMKRFMRVLQCALRQNKKVSAVTFQNELQKILHHSRNLISLLTSNDTQAAIFAREFKVLDLISKFLYNFFVNPDVQNVVKHRKFDLNQLVEFLENLATITLNATHGNELTHIYVSQYVRTYIQALFNPSPLFKVCDKDQTIALKDKIILLLYRFLWDKDLDTLGQLNFYEKDFFQNLDNHSDYSPHLLQLMNHYCSSKAPNLVNSLRESFITKYVTDDERIRKIFPVLTYIPNEDDFELQFKREDYEDVIRLGSAPPEIHNYLVWTFKVINSVSEIKNLKFLSTIINYYPENICESLVTCKKVAPNVKNEILITMKNVHFGYGKLPFDAIPQKIQVVLSSDKLDKYLKSYSTMVKDAEQTIVSDLEKDLVMRNRVVAKNSKGISVQSLTADILKNESEQLNSGNLQSLQFTLQVMKNILGDEHSLTYENLYRIHHSLCHIIEAAADELVENKVGPYYQPFADNKEKIYEVLKEVDEHIVRLAFREAINDIKDKVLKASSKLQQITTVGAFSQPLASTYAALEEEIIRSAIASMSEDWKSKRKLYQLASQTAKEASRGGADPDASVHDETRLLQSLWKIIKSGETALTNSTVNLVKNKTNFETKFTKELSECSLLDEEIEVSSFIELASGLLAVNQVGRRIKAKIEFGFTEKETQQTVEAIIDKLEKILVTIYDYEGHLAEEGQKLSQEEAKNLFMNRIRYSKIKTAQEVPFGYKSIHIKTFYQKVLRMLDTQEILIPLIGYLHYRTAFDESVDPQRAKYAYTLIMMIICLFLHENTANQAKISTYPEFITIFYSELESASVEAVLMFAEMCNGNRKLLRLGEDYLFAVTSYTFVTFLNEFKVNAEQADSSNSINYIRSLPYVFSSDIPKDMFDPAEFMTSRFFEFYNFVANDKRLSLTGLLGSHTHETNRALADHAYSEMQFDDKIILDMPIFYSIVKEFLGAEVTFALTEIKDRVLALHSSLTLERVTPFLLNENIEFNFELKQLAMQMLENLYFKNTYKNTNIFYNYDHFVSFVSILLVDVYGYIKNLDKESALQGFLNSLFQTGFFASEAAKNYLGKYDKLIQTDLNKIVFLQYQSLMLFSKIWKDYIYYILCDFWGNLISYVKDFMLVNKEKDANRLNVFEIWYELIIKLKDMETDPQYKVRIDNALKRSIVLSDYAKYREKIYAVLGKSSDLAPSKTAARRKQYFQLDIEKILHRHFGEKSTYKTQYGELNLNQISKIMGVDRAVIKRLIGVLTMPETPVKDTIFILKLLRKLIENENLTESNINQPIYLWDDVSPAEAKKIEYIQNTLGELKLVNAIFVLLYKYEKNAVALREILLLCVSLLYGGNTNMQDLFYEEFRQDYDNEIIQNLTTILEDTLEAFSVKQKEKTSKSYFRALQFIFSNLGEYPETAGLLKDVNFELPSGVREKLELRYTEESAEAGAETPSIPFESYQLLSIILKFLQNLCEGHYLNFQEFLRDQTIEKHSRTFNIPEFLRQAYHAYYKNLSLDNIQIGTKILDLLIEIEQGESVLNIQLLLQKTFLNDICNTLDGFNNDLDLLARGFGLNRNNGEFAELKNKGLVLLKDLVERSEPKDLKTIVQNLKLRSLVSTFKENVVAFHEKKGGYPSVSQLDDKDIWDPNLASAFTVYFILKHLSFEETLEDFAPEIQEQIEKVFLDGRLLSREIGYRYLKKFFKRYTGSIEIFQKKANRLMKVYFPKSVVNEYLKADSKEEFEENVDRSNTQTKIADLFDASEELISQMEANYKSRTRLFGFNPTFFYTLLRIATSLLAFTMGFFNMFTLIYEAESEDADGNTIPSEVKYKNDGDHRAEIGINVTQSVISAMLLILWLYLKMGSYLSFKWNDFVNENVKEQGVLPPDVILKIDRKEPLDKKAGLQILKLRGPYSEEWESVKDFMTPTLNLYNLYFLIQSLEFLWHIAYIGVCIGSIFHPLAAAFQMCDLVFRSDTVGRVASAVTRNARQFMWTLILLFVTVYIYSFIGFYFLHERFVIDNGDGTTTDNCQDSYSCFLTSLNQGLRSGGGIGDFINKVEYTGDNKEAYFWNTVYDLSFFILMITLLLNLIFGMIIDAFGELRDEKNENEDDKLNVCFICGLERGEYERLGNFDSHIYQDHHMWEYIAYLVYLKAKEKAFSSELTDVESYVIDCLERRDYGWLPVGRSLTLERQYAKNKKEDKSEVLELREDLVSILTKVVEQNTELNNEVKELKSYMYKAQGPRFSLTKKPTEKIA